MVLLHDMNTCSSFSVVLAHSSPLFDQHMVMFPDIECTVDLSLESVNSFQYQLGKNLEICMVNMRYKRNRISL